MVYNKIYAQIGEERHITLDPINYQYDVKQILVISGETVPEYYEADICNVGDTATLTMIGTAADGVEIPDRFFRDGRNVLVYVVIPGSGGDVQTRYDITIPSDERGEREDIELDTDQQTQADSLIAALNSGVGRAEAAAEAIQDMDVEAETLAAGSAASVEKTVDPETGAVTLNFGLPKGEKGNPGNPGADGTTPNFRIGTVTTLPPESPAEATITGTKEAPVLNLGIPQGEKGEPGGDSGTSDYTQLSNKPQINGHTLDGNQSASDLGLGTYSKPASGIPKTDLADDVQQSLRKAETALQSAPVQSVAGKTGAVTLGAGDVGYDGTETYQSGTAGAALSELNRQLSDLDDDVTTLEATVTGKADKTTYQTVTASTLTLNPAVDNTMYLCGELTELTVTAPTTGIFAVRFTSGTTPTVVTLTGITMPDDWPSTLDASTIYEINVLNGYGVWQSWI